MSAARRPRPAAQRRTACLLALVFAACGGQDPQPGAAKATPGARPPVLTFDFGTIPHGEAREHDFVLDTHSLGTDFVALGVAADCTCSHARMFLRDSKGQEREISGKPLPEFAARKDELLVIRMQIDTAQKEPVDIGPVDSKASVVLQPVAASDSYSRVNWSLLFHFSVDSPVRVKPFAVLDFGSVPRSQKPQLITMLQSDLPRAAKFGPVHCDDPRLSFDLQPNGELTRLLATFTPTKDAPLEPFRALVTIATDLPGGYIVKLAATGQVVDDFEVLPTDTLSFRCDLQHEQPRDRATSQYLVLTDHDTSRPAEFVIAKFVDAAGRDASKQFEAWFEPVPGDDRGRRVFVRCLGGVTGNEFRGELVLAKDATHGPFLKVQVIAFAPKSP